MFWPKCMTYGNWGGPGWCGGRYLSSEERMRMTEEEYAELWTVPAQDEIDACFKRHDWEYQHGFDRGFADLNLVNSLELINPVGLWSNVYWYAAIVVFSLTGCIRRIRSIFNK